MIGVFNAATNPLLACDLHHVLAGGEAMQELFELGLNGKTRLRLRVEAAP
jgi:hypothetical protein